MGQTLMLGLDIVTAAKFLGVDVSADDIGRRAALTTWRGVNKQSLQSLAEYFKLSVACVRAFDEMALPAEFMRLHTILHPGSSGIRPFWSLLIRDSDHLTLFLAFDTWYRHGGFAPKAVQTHSGMAAECPGSHYKQVRKWLAKGLPYCVVPATQGQTLQYEMFEWPAVAWPKDLQWLNLPSKVP